jgi:hypothetical protein
MKGQGSRETESERPTERDRVSGRALADSATWRHEGDLVGGRLMSQAESAEPLDTPAARGWRWLREGYRKLREGYRNHMWPIIGLVALAALVFGVVGLSQLRIPPHGIGAAKPIPVPDLVYYLISLFRFVSPPVDPPYPGTLEVARWLAPLSLILAGLGAIAIFAERFDQLRGYLKYRKYRDHWVICGAGRVGMRLATTFQKQHIRVILVDHRPAAADIEQCRRSGVPLIVGDATDTLVLRQARISWAGHLVAVTGDDGVNTEVARQAADITQNRTAPLGLHVNVNDEELTRLLNKEPMFRSYNFFNVKRLGPRALLQDVPEILNNDHQPTSILIIGAGTIGVNLAVEVAHRWDVDKEEHQPRCITLADKDAEEKVADMMRRWGRFERTCELKPLSVDPWNAIFNPFGDGGHDLVGTTAVVICPEDDAAGLRVSLLIWRGRKLAETVPIVVCTTGRNRSMLELSSDGNGKLRWYGILDKFCEHFLKLAGLDDRRGAGGVREALVVESVAMTAGDDSNVTTTIPPPQANTPATSSSL